MFCGKIIHQICKTADFRRQARALAISVIGLTNFPANSAQAIEPQAVIGTGTVVGIAKGDAHEFLGIPYAAPPIGKLRWRPPQPPTLWTGLLRATAFGKTCPQSDELSVFATPSVTEDCLYLNVFTPAEKAKDEKLPVMVWIHGGALLGGETNDYDASKLVRQGHVVVVSMNYRLGVLGFFAQPTIDTEGHDFGNYGIMDQQFALRWVKKNIIAFGGDPGNITIFGQSAGGSSVLMQLASPNAAGLFQRAIIESAPKLRINSLTNALKNGQAFTEAAGCKDQSANCLRNLSVEKILSLQPPYLNYGVVGDSVVPLQPGAAFATGKFDHVPIVNGVVKDEHAYMLALPELKKGPLSKAGYKKTLATINADAVQKIVTAYPVAAYKSPSLAMIAAAEDSKACIVRKINTLVAVHGVPVYAYEFEDETAPSYFPKVSFPMGAYHTSELQFLFLGYKGGRGTFHPLSTAQGTLSDQMVGYWTNFARFGDPNGGKLPRWPRYQDDRDEYLALDIPTIKVTANYGRTHNCDFWDPINGD
jgi:para-nitrobenzyl esterase